MRNKKLISMLMLSAGFVACTQDEIVENGFAGIENQKDLVEDVVLNVSLGEDALTRAGYQGAYDKMDAEGNLSEYSVFRHFYLEPEWNSETSNDSNGDGVIGWDLTNNSELKGDMLGLCLTNGASAITNYPFYIAGYYSARGAADAEGNIPNQKVYALAPQTNKFYTLAVNEGQEVVEAELADLDTDAASQYLDGAPLAPEKLDMRQGILRTTSGIMTGDYVAYFPYNENWVDPSGIPAKGELPMQDLFEVRTLSADQASSLSAVHVVKGATEDKDVNYSFYDYMFAVSQNEISVAGGNRSGDVNLMPLTSALTFKLTNSALFVDEKNTGVSQEIKRVTIRAKEAGAAAFILNGSVDLTSKSSIKAGAEAGDVTDLIGVSFDKTEIGAAKADDPATEANEAAQTTMYVTIPFFANPAVSEYVIEVYNTNGQIAAIEKTISFKPGVAYHTTIDLAKDAKFVDATRKIFDETDFLEEVLAGGTLQLMRDINIPENVVPFTVENDLTIIGGKHLALAQGTFKKNITTDGKLTLDGKVKVSGKINANEVVIAKTSGVAGDIEANDLTINGATTYNFTQHLTVKNLLHVNSSNVKLVLSHVDALNLTNRGSMTVSSADVYGEDGTTVVGTNKVKVTGKLENHSFLTVNDLTVGTLENYNTVTVSNGASLTATTIINKSMYPESVNEDGSINKLPAKFTIYGSTNAASFNNESSNSVLDWATKEDMNMNVVNAGVFKMNTACYFTGTVTNTGNMTVGAKLIGATEGSAINNTAGTINIASDGYLELSKTKLNISGGVVDVLGGVNGSTNVSVTGGELLANVANQQQLAAALSTTAINAKFTGIKVNAAITWPNNQTGTSKKIYMYKDLTTGNKELNLTGGLVAAANSKFTAGKNTTISNIDVNATLELAGESAVTVTGDVAISADGSLNITNTGIVTVNGTIKNVGSYNHSEKSTVYGKYEGDGTWKAYPNF